MYIVRVRGRIVLGTNRLIAALKRKGVPRCRDVIEQIQSTKWLIKQFHQVEELQ
jgi:hypothetical protein